MNSDIVAALSGRQERWLVTGAAGFIGSHLVEALLSLGQSVCALDNFATGYRRNLDLIEAKVGPKAWACCDVFEGDIRDRNICIAATAGAEHVLHQAALGSVPRSLVEPLTTHDVNTTGFVNIIDAARNASVRNFVYAASSSTYGDSPTLPKVEDKIGDPLSPYALSKLANEQCAAIYARCFGFSSVGLRYFNVFGPRQDPEGAYAAVIPKWIAAMIEDREIVINGDGETSRDFCYIANVVQANLRAALAAPSGAEVVNIAVGERTTLNLLFELLRAALAGQGVVYDRAPVHGPFRPGDVRHSLASIDRARKLLGYVPTHDVPAGMAEAIAWYVASYGKRVSD